MEPKVIFQDDEILVLDKPAGWITNDAESTKGLNTIQEWLSRNFQFPISNFQEYRSGVVHRLDKETSGILLVAKTKEAFYELQRQFKERIVKKTYIALVHGKLEPGEGDIKATVGRLPWRKDRFGILPGGRESSTAYKVLSYCEFPKAKEHLRSYSLVEFYPKTGRTHQIRIHAKFLGHPLVSDEFYTGRKTSRADRKWCPRLFLHAQRITFKDPKSKKQLSFMSELPNDLSNSLSLLSKV
jgi:23S rRNA pseudouridine1911/1915/1917 synthase